MLVKALLFKMDDVLCSESLATMGLFHKAVPRICKSPGTPSRRSLLLSLLEYQEEGLGDGAWSTLVRETPELRRAVSYFTVREIVNSTVPFAIPYRGIPELVLALRRARLRLAAMAGTRGRRQSNKVQALGLESLFPLVVYTDFFTPDPGKALEKALDDLEWEWKDLSPEEIAYVADDPATDFPAARKLGMHTIRLRLGGTAHEHDEPKARDQNPEREFTSVRDLARALCRNFGIDPKTVLPGEWNYFLKPRKWRSFEWAQN